MKDTKSNIIYVLQYEIIQLVFFFIFLSFLYFQEINAIKFLNETNLQYIEIEKFLNGLQFPLLPDFFFIEFLPIVLISIGLIVFKRWRWFFLAFSGAALSILLIADKIYYSAFSSVITTESFSLTNQIWDVKSAIFESISLTDLFKIFMFSIFILFGIFYNSKMQMSLFKSKLTFSIDKILGILFFLLAIYCYNIAFFIEKRHVLITPDNVMRVSKEQIVTDEKVHFIPNHESSLKTYAATFGILNFHVKNISDAIKKNLQMRNHKNDPPPKHFYSFFEGKKKINDTVSPFLGIAKGRNVFLIHFESLHPLTIGSNIEGTPITPTLTQLAKTSLYWDNILDQTTIGGSSDAEFAVLTGLLPSTQKITALSTSCMPYISSLPKSLKSNGYQTISLHGYVSSFYNRNITQPLLGFESMYFKDSFHMTEKIGMGISDKEFFSQSIDLLKNHSMPFFAFMITLSSHHPYRDMPPDYQRLFQQTTDPDSILIKYFRAIRHTDDALGDFFSKIKKSGLWENSIFIIYGDHRPLVDDEMMEASIRILGKSFLTPRNRCLPIIIVIPGQEKFIQEYQSEIKDTVGGLYDIYPTIMHLLGYDIPMGIFGSHLFVKNEEKDPMPFLRFLDSFVYEGIQYRQSDQEISTDDMGIVFVNKADNIIENKADRLFLYQKALLSIVYCNYIYETEKKLF